MGDQTLFLRIIFLVLLLILLSKIHKSPVVNEGYLPTYLCQVAINLTEFAKLRVSIRLSRLKFLGKLISEDDQYQ